jgi:cbb3-type cytochrome oxidase subunit 3
MISGLFIIAMMVAFFAIVAWAWSDKRKVEFKHLSNLPLEEDIEITEDEGDQNGND